MFELTSWLVAVKKHGPTHPSLFPSFIPSPTFLQVISKLIQLMSWGQDSHFLYFFSDFPAIIRRVSAAVEAGVWKKGTVGKQRAGSFFLVLFPKASKPSEPPCGQSHIRRLHCLCANSLCFNRNVCIYLRVSSLKWIFACHFFSTYHDCYACHHNSWKILEDGGYRQVCNTDLTERSYFLTAHFYS